MLINIFPHPKILIDGKSKKNPNANLKDYIVLDGILAENYYQIDPKSSTRIIPPLNLNEIQRQLFPKKEIPRKYKISTTNKNTTLPILRTLERINYEPILIKIRGLDETLGAIGEIISQNFLRRIKFNSYSYLPNNTRIMKIENRINEYNSSRSEQERMEYFMDLTGKLRDSEFSDGY
jgi:wyosine [tRNA(Phe)-imidazoG37] synthetase (radical SAM superfamily)